MRKPVECKDGSWTFHNEEVGEAYHTPLGAAMEAREKYVAPCKFETLVEEDIIILDVCYGMGYNTAAALERIWQLNPACKVRVIGLEIDKGIILESLEVPFPFAHKEIFEALNKGYDDKREAFSYKDERIQIDVVIGDALQRITEVDEHACVVFFDPFSPKRQPELWTEKFFKDIYDRCGPGAVLVTYSCARAVREALSAAGFVVEDGPVVGRRGPATLAKRS